MPVKGMGPVRSRLRAVFENIAGPKTEAAVTEILIIGGGYADSMTPVDLGNLLNSRFRKIEKTTAGYRGQYGYTAAYAAAVHALSAKLKGKPRSSVSSFETKSGTAFAGDKGNFWDGPLGPGSAEPQWLTKGFEGEGLAEIKESLIRNMKV